MRAAVYKGEQVLQVEELPDPTPGPNQVAVSYTHLTLPTKRIV